MNSHIQSVLTGISLMFLLLACGGGGGTDDPIESDTESPVITLLGDNPMLVELGTSFVDPGATVTDNIDTDLTVTISGSVDTNLVGEYTLSYNATDTSGNAATTVTRVVTVVVFDREPPVITLVGDNPLVIEVGSTYTDPGATVTDNVDTDLAIIVTGSVNTEIIGEYTLSYNATDTAGNIAATETRVVNVMVFDTEPPIITLVGDNPMVVEQGSPFTDPGATASDNIDSEIEVVATGAVDTSVIGDYTISYSAIDAAGNSAVMVSRTVSVVALTGRFTGTQITGLGYRTARHTGITDENGEFLYEVDESITFFIGDVEIGQEVAAKSEMNIKDLVPAAKTYRTHAEVRELLRLNENNSDERRAFNEFSNILSLLHTLDEDADPNNGINIASGISELFLEEDVNFSMEYSEFHNNSALRQITHRASNSDLIRTGDIMKFGYGMDIFYEAQNIPHDLKIRVSTVKDKNADGIVNSETSYSYDANGDRIIEFEFKDSPSRNETTTKTYTVNGNIIKYSFDTNSDGVEDSRQEVVYDENHNLLAYNSFLPSEDTPTVLESNTYDMFGNMLTHADNGSISTYTYDSKGNQLTFAYDFTGDGVVNQLSQNTYDSNGNLLTERFDSNNDGINVNLTTYTYDENGNNLTIVYDDKSDGIDDRVITRTYDGNNNLLTITSDNDVDGLIDQTTRYTYNSFGDLLTISHQSSDDAEPTFEEIWEYDSDRKLLSFIWNPYFEEQPPVCYYTYDSENNLKSSTLVDGFGATYWVITYSYDSDGNRLTYSKDLSDDGSVNETRSFEVESSNWRAILSSF